MGGTYAEFGVLSHRTSLLVHFAIMAAGTVLAAQNEQFARYILTDHPPQPRFKALACSSSCRRIALEHIQGKDFLRGVVGQKMSVRHHLETAERDVASFELVGFG